MANELAKTREEQLAAMRQLGGTSEVGGLNLPLLKLEHKVIQGEANPDAGLFTLSRKDAMGNWVNAAFCLVFHR